ncbi:hypothetical protein ES708_33460 [subsurface metagenome]
MLDGEIRKLLSEYFDNGEDWEALAKKEEIPEEALAKTKQALQLINEYSLDFPSDLKNAVGVLCKYAVGYAHGYGHSGK